MSALHRITDPVVIGGYAQSGAGPNTNGPGMGLNTALMIELDGTNAEGLEGPDLESANREVLSTS